MKSANKSKTINKPKFSKTKPIKVKVEKNRSITESNLNKHNSIFNNRLAKLRKMTKNNPNLDVNYQIELYKALIDTTNNLIGIVEANIVDKHETRAIYAYNHLVSQSRECLNDLRSITNSHDHSERILDLLRLNITQILQSLVDGNKAFCQQLQAKQRASGKKDQVLLTYIDTKGTEFVSSQTKMVSEVYKLLEQEIINFYRKK